MWKGKLTKPFYEEFYSKGLCEEHSKVIFEVELCSEDYQLQKQEWQRKILLFIRLRMYDPIVFGRPCVSRNLQTLISSSKYLSSKDNGHLEKFVDRFILFDSIVVFLVCYFSKICCIGALFAKSSETAVCSDDEFLQILDDLISTKNIENCKLSVLFPQLEKNFLEDVEDSDKDIIRLGYAITLYFIRNITKQKSLKYAVDWLNSELKSLPEKDECYLSYLRACENQNDAEIINSCSNALVNNPYCHTTLINRAHAYMRTQKYNDAQLDSYIATIINPFLTKGYCELMASLFYQFSYEEAYAVAECGMVRCENTKDAEYLMLEAFQATMSQGRVVRVDLFGFVSVITYSLFWLRRTRSMLQNVCFPWIYPSLLI